MYYYYVPDRHRQRGEAGMVLVVIYPSCAHVSVDLKKAYLAYFVAYIAHSSVSVISDIYAKNLRENLTGSYVIYFTSQTFSLQEFPDRTNVLTVEQTCSGGLAVGGVWGG